MGWTKEQLKSHPKRNSLMGSEPVPEIKPPKPKDLFVVPGPVAGKPRMTQRDKWQKRPRVLRYRDYCDRIRAAAPNLPEDVYGIIIQAYIAMPESWSQKKRKEYHGTAHRTKPDFDNIVKSVCDALFKQDSILAGGTCWKYWCGPGEERTVIRLLYDE